jgi:hypothetical protein
MNSMKHEEREKEVGSTQGNLLARCGAALRRK